MSQITRATTSSSRACAFNSGPRIWTFFMESNGKVLRRHCFGTSPSFRLPEIAIGSRRSTGTTLPMVAEENERIPPRQSQSDVLRRRSRRSRNRFRRGSRLSIRNEGETTRRTSVNGTRKSERSRERSRERSLNDSLIADRSIFLISQGMFRRHAITCVKIYEPLNHLALGTSSGLVILYRYCLKPGQRVWLLIN